MVKKLGMLVVFVFLMVSAVWATEGTYAEVIPLTSSVYQEMDDLYALTNMGTPSNSRPWTKGEAQMILGRINGNNLSRSAQNLYDHLQTEVASGLRWQFDDGFGLGVNLDVNGEIYTHTNTTDYVMDTDWVYDYERRAPLANGRFAFGIGQYFYNFFDFSFGTSRESYNDTIVELSTLPGYAGVGALIPSSYTGSIYYDTYYQLFARSFGTNVPALTDLSQTFPNRAVLAFGGTNWVASFSRDRINWGNSHIGNMVIDDHVMNNTYARVAAFSSRFKFEATYLFFNTYPYQEDDDAWDKEPAKYTRVFMTHRLEHRIGKWLTYAVSENVMYQAQNGLNPYYMNPSYIFHNLDNKSILNALASAEVDFMPFKGLNLYGQYVLDQAQSLNEGDEQADANGYLAGLEYTIGVGNGVVSTAVEYARTTPELYRRNYVDFITMTTSGVVNSTNGYCHVTRFDYIGFPYGGDAQVLKWDVDYRIPGVFESKFSITQMIHGEMGFFTSHNSSGDNTDGPDIMDSTPYGTATRYTTFSLYGKYIVPKFVKWMDANVYGEVDYLTRTEDGNEAENDIQLTLGVGLTF